MYAYKGVSREEWLFRGLAIATILALVGMAVMPMAIGDIGLVYLANGDVLAGLGRIGGGIALDSGAILAVGLSGVETLSALALVGLIGTGIAAGILIG